MSIIQELTQKIYTNSKKYLSWLDLIFLSLLSVYVFSGMNLVPFHGDESAYIIISQDYDRIVKQRDYEHVLLKPETNAKQYLRLTTGSILAYSIGFARDITNNDDPLKKWLWGSSWEENIRIGNLPNPRLLTLARFCSTSMAVLGIILFFLTALQLFSSHLIAWAATLLLATHADILVNIRRAMQEGPKFLFLILTIYIASHIIKHDQNIKNRRYLYILLGAASGLTLATKQDIVPMLVAIYVALALIPIWKKETFQHVFANLIYLSAATILAYALFLACMPVFWGWWESVFLLIGAATIIFQLPVWKTDSKAKLFIIAGFILVAAMTIVSPTQWGKFFTPVTRMLEMRSAKFEDPFDPTILKNRLKFFTETIFTSRVMYMEVTSFDVPPFHEQITSYESSPFIGRIESPALNGLIALLAIIGGWSLLRQFNAQSLLIYSLFFISSILLLLMISSAWQRYFIIMQIPYSLFVGVGLNQILVWGTMQKQKKPASVTEAG